MKTYGKMTLLGIQLGKKHVFLTIPKKKKGPLSGKMHILQIQLVKKHGFLMIDSTKTPCFARSAQSKLWKPTSFSLKIEIPESKRTEK